MLFSCLAFPVFDAAFLYFLLILQKVGNYTQDEKSKGIFPYVITSEDFSSKVISHFCVIKVVLEFSKILNVR